jgi:hypothetical protein
LNPYQFLTLIKDSIRLDNLFRGASHSYEQSSKWKCVPFCLLNPLMRELDKLCILQMKSKRNKKVKLKGKNVRQ